MPSADETLLAIESLVERASTGRRLFIEIRRGVIYQANLGGRASVL
jgi:hypothetical protein